MAKLTGLSAKIMAEQYKKVLEDKGLAFFVNGDYNLNIIGVRNGSGDASKFDDFIKYQHETLANLKLVGREKDGTPNHFVNVTGMQRLHNGAIWQQYTEMEKMKELMYDTMVQLLGKETADKKLEQHDIKLLDESLDVTDSLWSKVKNKAKSLFKIIK